MKKEIIINNDLKEAAQISQFLESLGTSLSLPPKITMGMVLAIEEITTAIIENSYPEKEKGEIRLQVAIEPDVLIFRIIDQGVVCYPTRSITSLSAAQSELQMIEVLGDFLIYRIMDEVSYNSENGVNQLTMTKRINTTFSLEATLNTNICRIDGIVVLNIEGRLDTANARDFNQSITPLLEEAQLNLIINCEQMTYISSSGLRYFLILQKAVKKNNGTLLIEAMRPEIKHVFGITGCASIFNIR